MKKIFEYDEYFNFKIIDLFFIVSVNFLSFCCGVFLTYSAFKDINIIYVIGGGLFVGLLVIENIRWIKSYINIEKRRTHAILIIKLQKLSKELYKEDFK